MGGVTVGLDFGISNLDGVAWEGAFDPATLRAWRTPAPRPLRAEHLAGALADAALAPAGVAHLGVTGSRHGELPDVLDALAVRKAPETAVLACGALALAGQALTTDALVVSAGSGTAVVHTRQGAAWHVGGSAVGGGTVMGLARLLLGTGEPEEVAALAQAGRADRVDLSVGEAIGGPIGMLPASATAVNFGKVALARADAGADADAAPERADVAAALLRLVAQVIGVVACNAALRAGTDTVLYVGHVTDFAPVRAVLREMAALYGLPEPIVPPRAGWATAVGAALRARGE
jgi:type II pantothenate kinase